MSLTIYTSNRMENLVEALAGVVREPLASPFVPEVIVVQSKGMQRWLSMELSRRFGVWANCDYPFPNSMVWRLFTFFVPGIPETSPFAPEIMAWRIAGILPRFLEREEFSRLRHYLEGDCDGLKLFQLSEKIADTFDQYTLYRPEMLLRWEKGSGGDWQELLWRALAQSCGGMHRGRIKEEFGKKVKEPGPSAVGIPERVSLFGISSLPAFHVEVFASLSRVTDVNLFLLSPTREYWADIVSAREMAFRKPGERPLLTEGNPLLASLGKLGRDFSDMIVECGELASWTRDLYEDPGESSLLKAIQSDILNLRRSEGRGRRVIDPQDNSVQIHSCHSPMREMEVLHDNILSLLDQLPALAPRDIVVMTPDIEAYAPYISAVFEGCQDPARKIPFSIADRSLGKAGQVSPLLLKLLGIPGSRLTAAQVLDILESPPVGKRFGLYGEELGIIRGWMEETRIRWGMDAEDRARLGLPPYRENSWSAGIDRLLLGYAMPEADALIFNGILPCEGIEGNIAATLGKFLDFLGRIRDVADRLACPRPLSGWRDDLGWLLREFIATDGDSSHELDTVAGIVESLGQIEEGAGFSGPVDIAVIRAWISGRLARQERGLGFLTGGVTFCEMLPMRSIPFRVVALVGMNDGAFPRQGRPPGFDLIAGDPRRGDRSLRDEDRYLFLESLLSARDCFYVSYLGQSLKDNSEIPPSVLVSELTDYISREFAEVGRDAGRSVVTMHRLQAFSREYFEEGSRLSSYSTENCAALQDRRDKPRYPGVFVQAPIPAPPDEWKDIPLARLIRFFDNPSRFFLENRLGIRLEEAAAPLGEREPFDVDGLEGYHLRQQLVEWVLAGGDARDLLPVARSRGMLPPARHGELLFEKAASDAREFSLAVKSRTGGLAPLEPLDFEVPIGGFRVSGRLDRIWPDSMLRYRCAKMKGKDLVRTWVEHLVLNHLRESGYPRESTLVMLGDSRRFRSLDDASAILLEVCNLYWEGLTLPLRFFPESSMAYAERGEWNVERARKKWRESFNDIRGEGDDPYFRLCFGEADPFDEHFERVSRSIFEPLLGNLS